MKLLKTILKYFGLFVVLYIVLGSILHFLVFPQSLPDYDTYFKQGAVFENKWEGFHQTILKRENGIVFTRLKISPGAQGPPMHTHNSFTETFYVAQGTLSLIRGDETLVVNSGEMSTVPPNTPHKPFNPTDEIVIVEPGGACTETCGLPEDFAFTLSQLYGFIDESPEHSTSLSILLQISVMGSHFDSTLAEGPPVVVQRIFGFLVAPTARLMGYRLYNPDYTPK